MNIEEMIEQGSEESKHGTFAKISERLAAKHQEAVNCLKKIEAAKETIDTLEKNYRTITEEDMPEIMTELGVSSVTLPSGEVISIETNLHCGIPAMNKEQAFDWLRNQDHGDLIKNEIIVKFGRNEDNLVGDVKATAEKLGLKFDEKSSVHPQTLKAFIKEQMKLGVTLPQDLFGIFIRRVVNVKLKG